MPLQTAIGVSIDHHEASWIHCLPNEEEDSLEDKAKDHELRLLARAATRHR